MTIDEMQWGLEKGFDPLALAWIKWNDIVEKRGQDIGRFNCALCNYYRSCIGCPIKCENSGYNDWRKHMLSVHGKFPWLIEPECFCKGCIYLATKIRDRIERTGRGLDIAKINKMFGVERGVL